MIDWFGHLYPYTNVHELNLDWVIATVKAGEKEIKNFVGLNTIKYADPILWDITSQYEANTVVVDGQTGNAYISIQPIPVGIALSRTDYWTAIFNYGTVVDTLMAQIASNEGLSQTATQAYAVGDLVFTNSLLYEVISPMIAGDAFVEGSNTQKTTVGDVIKLLRATVSANTTNITAISDDVGNLADLSTTDKDSVVDAINEVVSGVSNVDNKVGNLSNLTTSDKDSIVNAINEVVLQTKKPLVFNVLDFGAVGDGVTDDTTSFNDAIAAAGDFNIVFVPAGTYIVSGLTISTATSIVGVGAQSTISCNDNTKPTIKYTVVDYRLTNIKNLYITHKSSVTATDTNANGIELTTGTSGQGLLIENVIFSNNYNSFQCDANIAGATIRDCWSLNAASTGFKFNHGIWYVYNTFSYNSKIGFHVKPSYAPIAGFYFVNCTAYRTEEHGYLLDGSTYALHDVMLNGCVAGSNRYGGFVFSGSGSNHTITSCYSEYAGYADENKSNPYTGLTGSGISISGHNNIVISDFVEFESNNDGVSLYDANDVIMSNCACKNNVVANLYIIKECDNINVHDCIMTSVVNTPLGIVVDDSVGSNTNIVLKDINLTGCVTAANIQTPSNVTVKSLKGYTPVITTPTIASGQNIFNNNSCDVYVSIRGSLTGLSVGTVGIPSPGDCNDFILKKGQYCYLTYTGAAYWSWYALD